MNYAEEYRRVELRNLAIDRREDWIRAVRSRYGILMERRVAVGQVIVGETNCQRLRESIMTDPTLDAVGRGYYLGLGGEIEIVTAPDWTMDNRKVAIVGILGFFNAKLRIRRLVRRISGGRHV